jgi:hypothetical protein
MLNLKISCTIFIYLFIYLFIYFGTNEARLNALRGRVDYNWDPTGNTEDKQVRTSLTIQ